MNKTRSQAASARPLRAGLQLRCS